jgi:hypothetical protein
MKFETKRICIYPKDVQIITGRSYRYSRLLLKAIRQEYGKEKHQLISVEDFCKYTGLNLELVMTLMVG